MVMVWANRPRGSEAWAEGVTCGWRVIDCAAMAQSVEVSLGMRVQVMPGGLDVPVSVSREALAAMTRSAVPGLPHAEAMNSGSPSLIEPQIGAVSKMASGGAPPSEPVPG